MATCTHLNQIRKVTAHTKGCEECLKTVGREYQKSRRTLVASRDPGTEGENNPAPWGRLDGKKKSGHRKSVFLLDRIIGQIEMSG
jgi:hypothetical protein